MTVALKTTQGFCYLLLQGLYTRTPPLEASSSALLPVELWQLLAPGGSDGPPVLVLTFASDPSV